MIYHYNSKKALEILLNYLHGQKIEWRSRMPIIPIKFNSMNFRTKQGIFQGNIYVNDAKQALILHDREFLVGTVNILDLIPNNKITIKQMPSETTITSTTFTNNGVTNYGISYCHNSDIYRFEVGAKTAFDRAIHKGIKYKFEIGDEVLFCGSIVGYQGRIIDLLDPFKGEKNYSNKYVQPLYAINKKLTVVDRFYTENKEPYYICLGEKGFTPLLEKVLFGWVEENNPKKTTMVNKNTLSTYYLGEKTNYKDSLNQEIEIGDLLVFINKSTGERKTKLATPIKPTLKPNEEFVKLNSWKNLNEGQLIGDWKIKNKLKGVSN